MDERELYHYGVLGMHWGVTRYKRANGSLTRRGKKEFKKVANSKKRSSQQSKSAIKMLTKAEKHVNKKATKYTNKSERKPDNTIYLAKSKKYINDSKILSEKISNIKSNKMKAGRDYIVVNKHVLIPYAYIGLTGPRVKIHSFATKGYIIEKNSK